MIERELPEGWIDVQLRDVAEVVSGIGFPNSYQGSLDKDIPFFKVGDISKAHLRSEQFLTEANNYIDEQDLKKLKGRKLPKGTVVFAKIGEALKLNRRAILSEPSLVDNNVMGVSPILEEQSKFLYFFLLTQELAQFSAGNAVPSVRKGSVEELLLPLPPFAEQKRIVAKLDKAFQHLDTLKARLERILELLKSFRQSILTQAVTGKLTEDWRDSQELADWKFEKAQDCCSKVQSGGTPKPDGFDDSGVPFLKVYNIVNQKIDFNYKPQFVKPDIHSSKLKKSIAFPGDVLMNIVGPPLGKIAILPDEHEEWNHNQAITLFRTKKYLLNKYLYFYFCEGVVIRDIHKETRGMVGQVNISLSQCRNFEIPIPPLAEQKEIVKRVETLFAKADAIKGYYIKLKEKIDKLPQALLAKAFRGELVPQDPNDEPASLLLEKIKAVKAATSKPSKGKKNISKTFKHEDQKPLDFKV
ncbi:restriction endonuclease subunit S [Pontibacter pamirensis]|uniref:restriction endonuclease subunit S n=1 Tax=Pontibacter pamirensis TaxID=2562824 RepID=UPI001389E684|nr:restriction endonuclease subunit S [Pontibacter pamirensis]